MLVHPTGKVDTLQSCLIEAQGGLSVSKVKVKVLGGADSEWSPSALSPKLVHFPAIRFAKVTCLKSEATASASESAGSQPMLPSPRAKPHPSVLLLCRYSTHPESCQPIHPAQLLWA